MATIALNYYCDLNQAVKVQYIDGNVFSGDNAGNTISIFVMDGDQPATIGGSVSADVIRADGSTVAVSGALDGNRAYVILPQACYAVPGSISIVIKNTQNTTVTTIAALVGNVYRSSTDTVVDPGTIIPSISSLIAAIDAAIGSIPADYSALLASIAADYSSSKTYPVGAYCWEAGVLKRCIVPITSPETYTAAHWTNAVIGDDLSALKSALSSDESLITDALAIEHIDKEDVSFNAYLDYDGSGIKYVLSQNYKAIYERALNGANILALTGKNTSTALYGMPALAFYDSNKTVLSGSVVEWSADTNFDYTYVKVPATAEYFSFCGRITNDLPFSVSMFYSDSINDIHTELGERVVRYATVADMIADTSLKSGMCAVTYGYAEINDGGNAVYRIDSTASGVYETLDNGLYAIAIIDESSVLNYAGETIEEKVQGFMETATEGKMLDLKGARINITERYTKSAFSRLQYMSISNGHFYIPYEIGGWLNIPSSAGYRPPVFINCTFSGGGSLFYDMSISFKAIGCIFKNVQIIRHGSYVQDIQLNGCNVTCLVPLDDNDGDEKIYHAYFIDAETIIVGQFNNCSFESENRGIINASVGASRASLTGFSISRCAIEGIPSYDIIRTHGIRNLCISDTYIEKVYYLIYDTIESNPEFRMSLINCHIDNRAVATKYLIRTNAEQPKLIATGNFYVRNDGQFLCNFDNSAHVIEDHNLFNGNWLYGHRVTEENPSGVAEYNTNHFRATGKTFSFKTLINAPGLPQAFIVVVQKTDTTSMTVIQEVYLLTLAYSSATGYSVEVTPIKENENMTAGDRIAWTATTTGFRDAVTITGASVNTVSISLTNLGAVFNGIAMPGLTATN